MTNILRFCKPLEKPMTFRAAKRKVISDIEKQRRHDIGNNASPAEVLTYWTKMAFDCAIHIAYLARQVPKEEDSFPPGSKSHIENIVNNALYDDNDLSEYYQCYWALDESLRRTKQIDQTENIIQRWLRDKAIRFYGKGGNSNLGVALAFSEWIYDLCLTHGAEQMGMDGSLVIKSSDTHTLNWYKLAIRKLLEKLPDESVWSKTRIQEECECISSGIATEYDIYKAMRYVKADLDKLKHGYTSTQNGSAEVQPKEPSVQIEGQDKSHPEDKNVSPHPVIRLADAVYNVYNNAKIWEMSANSCQIIREDERIGIPVNQRNRRKTGEDLRCAQKELEASIMIAVAAIPSVDKYVRDIAGTKPGQWSTELKSKLMAFWGNIGTEGVNLFCESFLDEWNDRLGYFREQQRFLRNIDTSVFDEASSGFETEAEGGGGQTVYADGGNAGETETELPSEPSAEAAQESSESLVREKEKSEDKIQLAKDIQITSLEWDDILSSETIPLIEKQHGPLAKDLAGLAELVRRTDIIANELGLHPKTDDAMARTKYSAKILRPLLELAVGAKQAKQFYSELRSTLKFYEEGDYIAWRGRDGEAEELAERLESWHSNLLLLTQQEKRKTEPPTEADNDLAKTESEDSRMGDNKDVSKKLRDIANIFNGWSSDAEKGKYKNNKAEAEKIIRNGLEKAADLMPLINTLMADYGLRDHDPELNNATPHNALHYLEVRHVNQNKDQIERHVRLLVKALTGQEPLGFFRDFLALAKELNRWADELEREKGKPQKDQEPASNSREKKKDKDNDSVHATDFRSVRWFGKTYSFTSYQAAAVKVLWEAWENGTPEVGTETILEESESESSRIVDIFKNSPAWMELIVAGNTKGSYRLNEPSLP